VERHRNDKFASRRDKTQLGDLPARISPAKLIVNAPNPIRRSPIDGTAALNDLGARIPIA
jgi:hypothetical protein